MINYYIVSHTGKVVNISSKHKLIGDLPEGAPMPYDAINLFRLADKIIEVDGKVAKVVKNRYGQEGKIVSDEELIQLILKS